MASGIINNKKAISGSISSNTVNLQGRPVSSSGTVDHSRLINRDAEDQHPIEAITGLKKELDTKLNAHTAMPLIEDALQNKAKGLYFDAMKEFAKKSYWYLTSEIDPVTKMGTKESIISGPYDLGMGGGGSGGSGGVTTVSIKPDNWPTTVSISNKTPVNITVNWSSTIGEEKSPTGNGTLYLTVNDRQVEVRPNCAQGAVTFDISKYVVIGSNNIQVKVLDMYGTTGLTIGVVNAVALGLTSNFDGNIAYEGFIPFTYIPSGDVEKTVHFILDGQEHGTQTVAASGESQTYIIKDLTHGAHTLEVYFTAVIAGNPVESDTRLYYDIIYYVPGNTTPIIASEFNAFEQEQYLSFDIPYRVYINGRNTANVTLSVNGKTEQELPVDTSVQRWSYKNDIPGTYILTISCESISKSFTVHIAKSTIEVSLVSANLALALSAYGRGNNEKPSERSVWKYTDEQGNTYSSEFSNFNWSSDGWLPDAENNTVLRVGGGALVTIPFEIFGKEDFTTAGKTIELEIATHDVRNYDTAILTCLDKVEAPFFTVAEYLVNEEKRKMGFKIELDYSVIEKTGITDNEGKYTFVYRDSGWFLDNTQVNINDYGISIKPKKINTEGEDLGTLIVGDSFTITYSLEARGINVTPQIATIRSQQSVISTQYKEDEHVRISFVVEQTSKDRIIWMYLNGIASGAMQYPIGDKFQQIQPSFITIGSKNAEATVDIYNIRVYNNSLTSQQIINNWIADTQNAADRATRYKRNKIVNSANEITINTLTENFSEVPYVIWDIDPLPEFKGDKRPGNTRFVDIAIPKRNFTAEEAEYNVQGTSSAVYPTKNIRTKYKAADKYPNFAWYDDDGNDLVGFPITYPDGIADNYFTFKVDFASSEGANNVELVRLYNDACLKHGILTPPQRQNPKVRVGIDGFPVIAFHQDKDGNIKFHTKANFNNDKANEAVYGFADGDESWEITNNSAAETKFQVPLSVDNFDRGFEIRFPDKDGYSNMSKLGPMTEWLVSTYREQATNLPLPEPITYTYQETIAGEDGSFATTTVSKTFEIDTKEYRLTKFKAELKDWFDVNSSLFYYLFTSLFLMIDSRAKNAFPTYFASRTNEKILDTQGKPVMNTVVDTDGKPRDNTYTYSDGGHRWFWLPYDMDTAIGIDNKGKLTFDYLLEDTDLLDNAAVYNGQDSVMWTNIRDAFAGELASLYADLRTEGLISYDNVESMFEAHQSKWPEAVFNLDSHNKYILPLRKGDNYLEMLQGSKAEQRKWWLYNRFKYIDSKYNAGEAKEDFLQFRAYVDIGEEKPNLEITPYASIYATASFGNGARNTVSKRAINRGEKVILENPFGLNDDENDQETYIYSASQLKSIGDISGFHPDTVKIGNAIRLQELKVGDASPDYENPHLKELTVGANTLLRKLDARNCINLGTGQTSAPDLSKCTNIEEVYFSGTKIKGITLPVGGVIKHLHLPGTLTDLTIRNHPLLTDLQLADTNTTITQGLNTGSGVVIGKVVEIEPWGEFTSSAYLYLADDINADINHRIRIGITNKALYDTLRVGETYLQVEFNPGIDKTWLDARYDLMEDKITIVFAGYALRFINVIETDEQFCTVDDLLNKLTPSIPVPTPADFNASLIETLWLEGIPFDKVDAKGLVSRMKPNRKIRLIGINEHYAQWEDIREFYNVLDRHQGLNGYGQTVDTAQITGTIHVPTISYANYIALSARYPEVKIEPEQLICTVTFINENTVHSIQNIVAGCSANTPTSPIKQETQANYYTFDKWLLPDGTEWTTSTIITTDIDVHATYTTHTQQYTATFETDSNIIEVQPSSQTKDFATPLTEPILIGIPDGVELLGWYNGETRWQFTGEYPTLLTENIHLVARWKDANLPSVTASFKNYNSVDVVAHDNLGISAYAVIHNSSAIPTEWIQVPTTTDLCWTQTLTAAGNWYIWVTDKNKNTACAEIAVYEIQQENTPGIEKILLTENGSIVTSFAQRGTKLSCNVVIDSHYQEESLKILLNNQQISNGTEFIVDKDIYINASCIPKNYTVKFVTGKETIPGTNTSIKEPDQIITYLHAVEHPASQYYAGEIIEAWYTDLADEATRWVFADSITTDATAVRDNITLYAKWIEYRTPTKIKLLIKEANTVISVNYTQSKANTVLIDWGDIGDDPALDLLESSNKTLDGVHLTHIYKAAGEYTLKIWGTKYGYNIGYDYDNQVVTPSSAITDIEFAWDLANTARYALKGASIRELRLTSYMKEINTGAFESCMNLETITIPKSIKLIRDSAFMDCQNLRGPITLPNSIVQLGTHIFNKCYALEGINFEEGYHLDYIPQYFCGSCSSIKKIDIPMCVASIGAYAFAGARNLEKVVLRNPNLRLSSYVFNNDPRLLTVGPIDPSNPGGNDDYNIEFAWTDKIPGYAFSQGFNQGYIKEATLPEGITEIGVEAFSSTKLQKINFPTSLTIIRDKAFFNTSLTKVDLPFTITELGAGVFSYCYSLSDVTLRFNNSLTKVAEPAQGWFYMTNTALKIKIPENLMLDPTALVAAFGPYWNVYGTNTVDGELLITWLMTTGIPKE